MLPMEKMETLPPVSENIGYTGYTGYTEIMGSDEIQESDKNTVSQKTGMWSVFVFVLVVLVLILMNI